MIIKWIQSLLTLCCAFSFGCDRNKLPENTESTQVIHLNLSEDPATLDPRLVRVLKDLTVVKQLFEGLTRLDDQGVPQPALAAKIDISQDCTQYTFTLKDACWTNGDPVTAEDFVYAWRKVLDPQLACDYSHLLYPIKNARQAREGKCAGEEVGFRAIDEKTLVVQLEYPTPYFLELTAFPTFFPIPSKLDKESSRWALPPGNCFVCNGPFMLKQWNPQTDLILKKNPSYWDADNVHLNEIVFAVITNNMTESLLYDKGELDWLGQPISHEISSELLEKMKATGTVSSYPVAGTFWFKFNTEKLPFSNAKIRRAFAFAINRKELISHLLQGNQTIATGALPPTMALQNEPYFQDADITQAQALFEEGLSEEGWTKETFPEVALSYNVSERNSKIVQLVQQQWKKAFDVTAKLEGKERHLYKKEVQQGLFQVGTGEWIADFNDPITFLDLFKYRNDAVNGSGMNDTGWHSDAYTDLLERALKETTIEKRKAYLHEAEKILVEAMPIAPVYHYAFDYAKKEGVENVFLSPLGIADFKHAMRTQQRNIR